MNQMPTSSSGGEGMGMLVRRAAINWLDSPRKLQRWPFAVALAWLLILLILVIAASPAPIEQVVGDRGGLLLDFARLAVAILMLVQCFVTKDILEDHLAGPENHVPNPLFSNDASRSIIVRCPLSTLVSASGPPPARRSRRIRRCRI